MQRLLETEGSYSSMTRVTEREYLSFINKIDTITIDDTLIQLGKVKKVERLEPEEDRYEGSTVWSFPNRGDWSTHEGNYRGNWSPYIPRNLISRYTKEGDLVLDQMMGSGTTLIECKLLNRDAIGVDINYESVMIALDRLNFDYKSDARIETYHGDARNLDKIDDESVDLIATHPPYAGIISYSKTRNKADLSSLSIKEYLNEMRVVAEECFRVLKGGKHCAILIGDTRKHKHYIPISHNIMHIFLDTGFILREYIIKVQHNTKKTREVWRGSYDFYKIAHEHLFVFRKPAKGEKTSAYIHSMHLL